MKIARKEKVQKLAKSKMMLISEIAKPSGQGTAYSPGCGGGNPLGNQWCKPTSCNPGSCRGV